MKEALHGQKATEAKWSQVSQANQSVEPNKATSPLLARSSTQETTHNSRALQSLLFKLKYAHKSLGDLTKMRAVTGKVWSGPEILSKLLRNTESN
jgi:hypothetical protein